MKLKRLSWTVLKTALLGISVLSIVAVLLATWMVRRAWPQESGRIDAQGFTAPIEVRDLREAPHGPATNERDLFLTQGFIHAWDVYFEELDEPERPTAALFQARWEKLSRTTERVPVKGTEPEVYKVLEGRHGPLIHKVWQDWQDAPPMTALSHRDTPNLNFLYADGDDPIGAPSTARVPRRAPGHDGSAPVAGWDGRLAGSVKQREG